MDPQLTVPEGWMFQKDAEGKDAFISPDGDSLPTRRAGLRHMINIGAPDEAIEEMRPYLEYEGWQDHPDLPKNWKYKISQTMDRKRKRSLMGESGTVFKNWAQGITHLESLGQSAEKLANIGKIEPKVNSNSTPKETLKKIITIDLDSMSIREEDSKPMPKETALKVTKIDLDSMSIEEILQKASTTEKKYDLIEKEASPSSKTMTSILLDPETVDATVPKGWKTVNTDDGKTIFLCPDGRSFPNRRAGLKYMIAENFQDSDILEMHSCMQYEGWKEHEKLPTNWKVREKIEGRFSKSFLMTDKGKMFEMKDAVTFMIASGGYSESVIDTFKEMLPQDEISENNQRSSTYHIEDFKEQLNKTINEPAVIDEVTIFKVKEKSNTEKSEQPLKENSNTANNKSDIPEEIIENANKTVPKGWQFITEGKGGMLQGPLGETVRTRRDALICMTKANSKQSEIEEMKQYLKFEGWHSHDLLPPGWKIQIRGNGTSRGAQTFKRFYMNEHFDILDKLKSSNDKTRKNGKKVDLPKSLDYLSTRHKANLCLLVLKSSIEVRAELGIGDVTPVKTEDKSSNEDVEMSMLKSCEYDIKIESLEKPNVDVSDTETLTENETTENTKEVDIVDKIKIILNDLETNKETNIAHKDDDVEVLYQNSTTKTTSLMRQNLSEAKYQVEQEEEEDDQSVPVGWTTALDKHGRTQIIGSDGSKFNSRRAALAHMKLAGRSEEELQGMKDCLRFEGWLAHYLLPPGWKIKIKKSKGNQKKKMPEKLYMTDSGDVLVSVATRWGPTENLTDEQMANLQIISIKSGLSILNEFEDVGCQPKSNKPTNATTEKELEVIKDNKVQIEKPINDTAENLSMGSEEEGLDIRNGTTGLKGKIRIPANVNVDQLLSKYSNLEEAMQILETSIEQEQPYVNETIKINNEDNRLKFFSENLPLDFSTTPWLDHSDLPKGWTMKLRRIGLWATSKDGKKKVHLRKLFLPPSGIKPMNGNQALAFMQFNGYSIEDIDKFEVLVKTEAAELALKTIKTATPAIKFEEQVIETKDKHNMYSTPEETFDKKRIPIVSKEDWVHHPLLPTDWRLKVFIKKGSNTKRKSEEISMLKFFLPPGQISRMTGSNALDFMKENMYSKENINHMEILVKMDASELALETDTYESETNVDEVNEVPVIGEVTDAVPDNKQSVPSAWQQHPFLPKDWKFSVISKKSGTTKYFLPPNCTPSKKLNENNALAYMMEKKYTKPAIEMLEKLVNVGIPKLELDKSLELISTDNSLSNMNSEAVLNLGNESREKETEVRLKKLSSETVKKADPDLFDKMKEHGRKKREREEIDANSEIKDEVSQSKLVKSSKCFTDAESPLLLEVSPGGRKMKTSVQETPLIRGNKLVTSSTQVKMDEEWKEDKKLPPGWRTRVSGPNMKRSFLTNRGILIRTSRKAFQQILFDNFGQKFVEHVRSRYLIEEDGWLEHPKLPSGWLTKASGQFGKNLDHFNNKSYLNEVGDCFNSQKHVIDFMVSMGYSIESQGLLREVHYDNNFFKNAVQEDSIKTATFLSTLKKLEEDMSKQVSKKTEPPTDQPWGVGFLKTVLDKATPLARPNKKFSPDDHSQKNLLKQSISNQQTLVPRLAQPIVVKPAQQNSSPMPVQIPAQQLSGSLSNVAPFQATGQPLVAAGAWLDSQNLPPGWKTRMAVVMDPAQTVPPTQKPYSETSEVIHPNQEVMRISKKTVEEGLHLPPGWSSRLAEDQRRRFVTKEGIHIPSARKALRHLVIRGYEDSQIDQFRDHYLQEDGWLTHLNLPPGWKVKPQYLTKPVDGRQYFMNKFFLSESGIRFKTAANAVKFMVKSGRHNTEQQRKLLEVLYDKPFFEAAAARELEVAAARKSGERTQNYQALSLPQKEVQQSSKILPSLPTSTNAQLAKREEALEPEKIQTWGVKPVSSFLNKDQPSRPLPSQPLPSQPLALQPSNQDKPSQKYQPLTTPSNPTQNTESATVLSLLSTSLQQSNHRQNTSQIQKPPIPKSPIVPSFKQTKPSPVLQSTSGPVSQPPNVLEPSSSFKPIQPPTMALPEDILTTANVPTNETEDKLEDIEIDAAVSSILFNCENMKVPEDKPDTDAMMDRLEAIKDAINDDVANKRKREEASGWISIDTSLSPPKRSRGRPKGSKNKNNLKSNNKVRKGDEVDGWLENPKLPVGWKPMVDLVVSPDGAENSMVYVNLEEGADVIDFESNLIIDDALEGGEKENEAAVEGIKEASVTGPTKFAYKNIDLDSLIEESYKLINA